MTFNKDPFGVTKKEKRKEKRDRAGTGFFSLQKVVLLFSGTW